MSAESSGNYFHILTREPATQAAEDVERWYQLFERWKVSRVIMERARAAGIPYSEARERWTWEDIAAELAWEARQNIRALKVCGHCQVDPDDMLGEDGRYLDAPLYQAEAYICPACEDIDTLQRDLSKQDESRQRGPVPGRHVRLALFDYEAEMARAPDEY